jgi:hypothetical protein
MRAQGHGVTLIISPLLALMRNQIEAAQRLQLRALTINSTNQPNWAAVRQSLLADEVDLLLISPERLANDDFVANTLLPIAARIGLLVIDEAHCISDWGHDFRPDYRRIGQVLARLSRNIAVLATTATANHRVERDVASQLGDGVQVQRGPLMRDSLPRDITRPRQDGATESAPTGRAAIPPSTRPRPSGRRGHCQRRAYAFATQPSVELFFHFIHPTPAAAGRQGHAEGTAPARVGRLVQRRDPLALRARQGQPAHRAEGAAEN